MDYAAKKSAASKRLMEAVADLDLTNAELDTLQWLQRWEIETLENIASVIEKAAGYHPDPPNPKGAPMSEYVVELYRGNNPETIGTSLEDWDGALDADTTAWLTEQGWGTDDPDLWVNIRSLPDEEFAPNNAPISSRTVSQS